MPPRDTGNGSTALADENLPSSLSTGHTGMSMLTDMGQPGAWHPEPPLSQPLGKTSVSQALSMSNAKLLRPSRSYPLLPARDKTNSRAPRAAEH